MHYFLILGYTLAASVMTFYSGFGLGTVLMPLMAIFLPLPLAISLTAAVHLLHNSLKTALLWKSIHWKIALRFGSAALLAAIPGAYLLSKLSFLPPLGSYVFLNRHCEITLLRILIGILLAGTASAELFSKNLKIRNLYIGGVVSGFFGGLSGNQGAFRSAFLINLSKDATSFIATNAVIAVAVDIIRLIIYGMSLSLLITQADRVLLSAALSGGAIGVLIGLSLLKKTKIGLIQKMVIALLYLLGVLMIAGII